MKPPKLLAIPFILVHILPCCLAFLIFTLFTASAQAFIAFTDDALAFWETLVEWWEE